jgi:hypothetical protein
MEKKKSVTPNCCICKWAFFIFGNGKCKAQGTLPASKVYNKKICKKLFAEAEVKNTKNSIKAG